MKDMNNNQCFNKELQEKVLNHEFTFQESFWDNMENVLDSATPPVATSTTKPTTYQKIWIGFWVASTAILGIAFSFLFWSTYQNTKSTIWEDDLPLTSFAAANSLQELSNPLTQTEFESLAATNHKSLAQVKAKEESLLAKTGQLESSQFEKADKVVSRRTPTESKQFISTSKVIGTNLSKPINWTKSLENTSMPQRATQKKGREETIKATTNKQAIALPLSTKPPLLTKQLGIKKTENQIPYTYFKITKDKHNSTAIQAALVDTKQMNQLFETKVTPETKKFNLPFLARKEGKLALPEPTAMVVKKLPKKKQSKFNGGLALGLNHRMPFFQNSHTLFPYIGLWSDFRVGQKAEIMGQVQLVNVTGQDIRQVSINIKEEKVQNELAWSADIRDSVRTVFTIHRLTYLQLPILFKQHLKNASESLLVGTNVSWLLGSKGAFDHQAWLAYGSTLAFSEQPTYHSLDNEPFINRLDVGLVVGYQRQLTPNWVVDIRYTQGLRNIFKLQNTHKQFNTDLQIGLQYKLW